MRKLVHQLQALTRKAFSKKYLLLTNVGISVSLSGVGDIMEQHYEIYTNNLNCWDRQRTRHMSISGMTVGIFCHNWYNLMDRAFPGRTLQIVLKKVLIDQTIASPVVIFIFFATLAILRKATWKETVLEMEEKFIRLYTAEWIVWPPAQIVNFYLLPNKYRVLYDNTISLGYDVYTSYVINEKTNDGINIS
ncbi:mpv17-like protein 2 [Toxorhynchites rutilus septentrionalis]|uniref:mpv17-like protein 2 n=1 Tax=Toxorhynchites rutilus septentrionalis TaxID=329112 RepID=UPI00247A9ADE|nr:mpv17-like protein 2 [Toxorhynchites rutilus septentrionalis]